MTDLFRKHPDESFAPSKVHLWNHDLYRGRFGDWGDGRADAWAGHGPIFYIVFCMGDSGFMDVVANSLPKMRDISGVPRDTWGSIDLRRICKKQVPELRTRLNDYG